MNRETADEASPRAGVPEKQTRAPVRPKKSGRRPIVPAPVAASGAEKKRQMLADYIKLTAWWLGRPPTKPLPRRLEQVLRELMNGCSEKQIARTLGVSAHTVHEYIKELHKRLGVSSRGELLNRFLPRG